MRYDRRSTRPRSAEAVRHAAIRPRTDVPAPDQARRPARARIRPGKGVGARPPQPRARGGAGRALGIRCPTSARAFAGRAPGIACRTGGGGERRALAFRGAARGLRAARYAPCPARLSRAGGGGRPHGRLAAAAGSAASAPPPALSGRAGHPGPAVSSFIACLPCRSEEHTSELQSQFHLVCRLLLEKKKTNTPSQINKKTKKIHKHQKKHTHNI